MDWNVRQLATHPRYAATSSILVFHFGILLVYFLMVLDILGIFQLYVYLLFLSNDVDQPCALLPVKILNCSWGCGCSCVTIVEIVGKCSYNCGCIAVAETFKTVILLRLQLHAQFKTLFHLQKMISERKRLVIKHGEEEEPYAWAR